MPSTRTSLPQWEGPSLSPTHLSLPQHLASLAFQPLVAVEAEGCAPRHRELEPVTEPGIPGSGREGPGQCWGHLVPTHQQHWAHVLGGRHLEVHGGLSEGVSASTVLIASWRNSFPKPSSLRRELLPGVPTRLTDTLSQVPEPRREPVATRTVYSLMTCHLGVQSATGNEAGLAGRMRERMEKGRRRVVGEVGRAVPRGPMCQAGAPWPVPCQGSPLEL